MLNDYSHNIQKNVINSQNVAINSLYSHFPQLLTSKYRMTKMFLNRCSSYVDVFSSCIGNEDWKNQIFQHVPIEKRKECYTQWMSVKNCSTKHMGESFTLKLDLIQKLERTQDEQTYEKAAIEQYNIMTKNHFKFLKEDMPVEGEDEE